MARRRDFRDRRPARGRTGGASRVANPTAKDREAQGFARAWAPCSAWHGSRGFGARIPLKFIPFGQRWRCWLNSVGEICDHHITVFTDVHWFLSVAKRQASGEKARNAAAPDRSRPSRSHPCAEMADRHDFSRKAAAINRGASSQEAATARRRRVPISDADTAVAQLSRQRYEGRTMGSWKNFKHPDQSRPIQPAGRSRLPDCGGRLRKAITKNNIGVVR